MRLRAPALATCTLTFLLAAAGPASAGNTTGDFHYRHLDTNGVEQQEKWTNPLQSECIDVPDVTADRPAYSPINETDSKAYVYADTDCTGTEYLLAKNVGKGGEDMKFLSVVFV
ncbi:hypothetical protein AF335_09780 [Streptomyces eurocidicus]|uniref:Secreted protein n=1 Tax=Streptomyces eurocidicus TaxID=66423 RepID=A0A2N8NWR7_STREU|nr:hypothetical protein [Streptomyces eurocidicus]MBB5117986.1 hypothetical protein [Streptomyces eurocidicus]MBF6053965.1 hypothetical protein [Streptomyces eurocidicus]PNE33214.1 hypothetical protein AF335_09780 [Streptomyces eurocidicus]